MMVISGGLNALYGLIGVVNDQWVVWTNRASLYLDISQWGWIHLFVGDVMLLAGIGLFSGNMLARIVGVIVASLSLIANFFFIPAYPLWALIVITIDVLVIWALTAHGREMREPEPGISREVATQPRRRHAAGREPGCRVHGCLGRRAPRELT